jgi:hypothetical protein
VQVGGDDNPPFFGGSGDPDHIIDAALLEHVSEVDRVNTELPKGPDDLVGVVVIEEEGHAA